MRKTRAAIFGLLFLVSMLSVKIVYADDNASVIYGSRYNQGEPSISYAEDTCDMIMYIFANHANRYGLLRNDFGDPTNRDGILNMIGACENMRDYLAIFHYGHYANTFQIGWWKSYDGYEQYPVSVMHYAYFDDDGILVDDYAIFPLTDDEKPCFIFLWTCVNAEFYDYYDADDYETYPNYYYEGTGAVGMPLAFTHQSSPISFDGYRYPDSGSPYCFIGFNGTSK